MKKCMEHGGRDVSSAYRSAHLLVLCAECNLDYDRSLKRVERLEQFTAKLGDFVRYSPAAQRALEAR